MGFAIAVYFKATDCLMVKAMKKSTISIAVLGLVVCCFYAGCAQDGNGIAVAAKPVQAAQEEEDDAGLINKMSEIFEKTKASTPSVDDMKKMLTNTGEAAGDAADDTMVWANDTWKMLKDSGGTATDNTLEWLKDDWTAMNAWEYKVVSIDAAELASNPGLLESRLNESGKIRWECFHVSDNASGMKFFMKRQKKSYLKNIPLKDLMKLVPLLDGE